MWRILCSDDAPPRLAENRGITSYAWKHMGTSKNSQLEPRYASVIGDGMIRGAWMGQLGFFDTDKRLAALSAKGDPLEAIDRLVPWESFRADLEAVVLTPDETKKSSAGRKPVDALV